MIFKNVTKEELEKALKAINKKYKDNIIFNRFEQIGKRFAVTLRVKDSKGPGHRMGFPMCSWRTGECFYKNPRDPKGRRRLVNACWHVHGYFFDALWRISPQMSVKTGGFVYQDPGDNWQDRNIGSVIRPYYFSEACECEE